MILVSLALLVCAGEPGLQAAPAPAQQGASIAERLQTHCIFGEDGVVLDLEDGKQLRAVLFRHAQAHGWNEEVDWPDLVSPERAAACPVDVLDAMASADGPDRKAGYAIYEYRWLAQALERNGRIDDALALLDRALQEVRTKGSDRGLDVSALSQLVARLARHAGRWDAALEHAEDWGAITFMHCANCAASEDRRQRTCRARCLLAAHRYGELIDLARSDAASGWTRSTGVIEAWIDCELAEGRASSADRAMDGILLQVPDDAVDDCERALERWKLTHATREVQLRDLDELATWHPEVALPLVLSLEPAQVTELMSAFELEDRRFRQPGIARLIAEIGYPEAGEALDRACEQLTEEDLRYSTIKYTKGSWESGHRRWVALTEGAR